MAWRIQDSVIRGEVDNREKGIVRGSVWLAGLAAPVTLELTGNACADLAGCRLKFTNRQPPVPLRQDAPLFTAQRGRIGDLTASRKVRVFDVPVAQAYAMSQRGEKPPEHLANCLYLEWFSERNGRVVIESTEYDIEITPPEWRLTPADEDQRQQEMAAGWGDFMGRLDEAVRQQQREAKDPDEDWDEHDYERFLKESDARTDKYAELLDKYGDSADAEEKITEAMGWDRELTEEEQARIEEMNAACEAALNEPPELPDPLREGIDWIRTKDGDIRHPLQNRCFESARRFWNACERKSADDDLVQFLSELQITSAKLAGALGDVAAGRGLRDAAFTVAYLKRALDHLHKSQAGLEACAGKNLLPDELPNAARRELFEIREEILRLMQRFRDEG